jgi:hypothetical protein
MGSLWFLVFNAMLFYQLPCSLCIAAGRRSFATPAPFGSLFATAADAVPWVIFIGLPVVPILTTEDAFGFKVQGKSSLVTFSVAESAMHF